MSELFSKLEIPRSNTLGGVAETNSTTVCYGENMYVIQGDIILQLCPGSKFCFLYAQVQCMFELCSKFQIPATNTVEADAETRTVPQSDMVQNMYVFQGDIILK